MAIEEDSNEVIPTFDDSYYEERASVEKYTLRKQKNTTCRYETIVAHRSGNSSAETAVNLNRNGGAKSCQQEAADEKTNRGVRG
jgi:hypothetical protein